MKGRAGIKLGALVVALALAGALFALPFSASSVRSVSVTRPEQPLAEALNLSTTETEALVKALRGEVVEGIPGSVVGTYGVRIGLANALPRAYEVYITADKEVYLKRPMINRVVRSESPQFFFVHEAFEGIYAHTAMPFVSISADETAVLPLTSEAFWEYLKWDDNWYAGHGTVLPQAMPELVVISSADASLELSFAIPPDETLLTLSGPDGEVKFSGPVSDGLLPVIPYNGTYSYELNAHWDDPEQTYRGSYSSTFPLKVELPPRFVTPAPMVVQGELVAFYALHMPEGVTPVVETDMVARVSLFPYEDGYVMYVPTHYGTRPGEYTFNYGLPGEDRSEAKVRLVTREFHIQYMTIDPNVQAATQNPEAYAQYNRYFPQSREVSSPVRYYSEPFLLPVAYSRLTTEFGQTRYVNNAPTSSRHSGLDMAAPTGTSIVATNRGRVTLAMDLILTGNTLVIDHGQGLFSVHFHMHELHVTQGEMVERGQQVGTVGSTGFSTGPHLHFTMSYFSHNIEPGYFLVGEPITFANSARYLGR